MSNAELQNRAEASRESATRAVRVKERAERTRNKALLQVEYLGRQERVVCKRKAATAELDGAVSETRTAQEKVRTKVSIWKDMKKEMQILYE